MGNASCNVHGVDEAQAFLDAAFANQVRDRFSNVDKAAPAGHFKPELFRQRFHGARLMPSGRVRKIFVTAFVSSPPHGYCQTPHERYRACLL